MDNIDLTLRREFTENPTIRVTYEDTAQYNRSLDYKDQRRAKVDILGCDEFKFMFNLVEHKPYLSFFGENEKYDSEEIKDHEGILRITGILTETLQMEYDAGYGNENVCDCCGSYRSHILNSERYGICDSCTNESEYRNEKFWERKIPSDVETSWID